MNQTRQETRLLQGRRKSVATSTKISKHTTADMAYRTSRFRKPKFQIGTTVQLRAEKEAQAKKITTLGVLHRRRGKVMATSINRSTVQVKFAYHAEFLEFNIDGTHNNSSAYIKEVN